MKLPPRRILAGILTDAISDRAGMDDVTIADKTRQQIKDYKELQIFLKGNTPMTNAHRNILANACRHALIWRESYYNAWIDTGDKAVLLEARQDIDRALRTQKALGVTRHWSEGGEIPEGVTSISLFDLMKMTDGETARTFGQKA